MANAPTQADDQKDILGYIVICTDTNEALGRMSLSTPLGRVPKAFAATYATRAEAERMATQTGVPDASVVALVRKGTV